MSHLPTTPPPAVIGPNALIQTVRALQTLHGVPCVQAVLGRSGQLALLTESPAHMVPEAEFAALVRALADVLGVGAANQVLGLAGQLTAQYLLRHRIPAFFQRLLSLLPRRFALRLLLLAIGNHAWTFAGSGDFTYRLGKTPQLTVISPICPPQAAAGFYGGTFEKLIHVLIDPHATMHAEITPQSHAARCTYIFEYS